MALLLPSDYPFLMEQCVDFVEAQEQRFLVLRNLPLPEQFYQQQSVDLLIKIPLGYNDQGIDMFWTFPRLQLASGEAIINTSDPGPNGDNTNWDGREYCRWSRHWNDYQDTRWRAGEDAIQIILARIRWCLANPNRSL